MNDWALDKLPRDFHCRISSKRVLSDFCPEKTVLDAPENDFDPYKIRPV